MNDGRYLRSRQLTLLQNPILGLAQTYSSIYDQNHIRVGWPKSVQPIYKHLSVRNTSAIIGVQLGDEGKGRIVDNKIDAFLKKGIKKIFVVRFGGGSNAGHTVEKDGVKIALHQLPSAVLYKEAIGIMDRGMIINLEDLKSEIQYAEAIVGVLKGRILLSSDAVMATDIDRAREFLYTLLTDDPQAKGGTGRGIGPATAGYYQKTGFFIHDLLDDNWEEAFAKKYEQEWRRFESFKKELSGLSLGEVEVPDFAASKKMGKPIKRTVGNKKTFLHRLEETRNWLLKRPGLIKNTFFIHRKIKENNAHGVIFEGAQAVGLHPWLGTVADVTSTDSTAFGIQASTGWWLADEIEERLGVIKATYMSSVGKRTMPTSINLDKSILGPSALPKNASKEEQWAAWVRAEAHEFGTTTRRARDICHMDLELLRYNCFIGGIESLAATHLDIARVDENIKVCTHYTRGGKHIPYQPGLHYLEDVKPHYIELPGWDGKKAQSAKNFNQIPDNAKKYLSFIQSRVGIPITMATTGAERKQVIKIPRI